MTRGIIVERIWSDDDLLELSITVGDGQNLFSMSGYVDFDWPAETARALTSFGRQIHGGLYDLEIGKFGPEYGGGAFSARLHWYRPIELLISTHQQSAFGPFKGADVASEARLYLRTEPGLVDRFAAELPALSLKDGARAELECIAS